MTLTEKDLAFAARALGLKRTVRRGWTRVPGVKDPESVAEHSWGVALLAVVAAARDPTLDAAKVLRIAVAHDLAEVVTGDLVPGDYVDATEKRLREEKGLVELLLGLDDPARDALWQAWREYEDGESREARLVADLDKVEMALQAVVYAGEKGDPRALLEFVKSAHDRAADPALKALLAGFIAPRS